MNSENRMPFLALLVVMISTLTMSACNRRQNQPIDEASEISATLILLPDPAFVGPGNIEVQLSDPIGNPVPDATLRIIGDMAHAGMVPVFTELSAAEDGIYNSEYNWSMGGSWIISLEGELEDDRKIYRTFFVDVSSEVPQN